MPAPISYVCVSVPHAPRSLRIGGYVTVVQRAWAYCPAGPEGRHAWRQIEPTALAALALLGTTPLTFLGEAVLEDTIEVLPAPADDAVHRATTTPPRQLVKNGSNGSLRARVTTRPATEQVNR